MHKAGIVLLIAFFFSGCDLNNVYNERTVNNNSSIAVSFKFGGEEIHTLQSGGKLTKSVTVYQKPVFLHNPRITCYAHKFDYIVKDLESWNLSIYNSGTQDIIIKEKNNLLGNYGDKITVTPGAQASSKLYTNNPVFNASYSNNMPTAHTAAVWENGQCKLTVY